MSDRLTEQEVVNLRTAHDLGYLSDPIMLSLLDEVQASRKLVADLRALHVPVTHTNHGGLNDPEYRCSCGHLDPCPTIRMIDEAGL